MNYRYIVLPVWYFNITVLMLPVDIKLPEPLYRYEASHTVNSNGVKNSVAEPPLFWASPTPEVQGPGTDFGSDQIGSAPAPGKKRWLQAAPAHYTNIFHFERLKIELLIQVFFRSHLPL